ncbi:MAG TPA: periplasmic heavy metal sensor [Thermoanaerobaculia bacterium]|nr:periplasmic heavy metal sensor [Thermoanaerobaculia bacterium]
MRIKFVLPLLFIAVGALAQPMEPPRGGGRRGPELLPPPGWWHDPYLSESVNLTDEQTDKLDDLQDAARAESRQLERDVRKADDELRAALNDRNASVERIVAAGNRVATLRDQMLRKQIVALANQRAILTHAQWTALQKQLDERRGPPMHDRGGFRPGGPPRGGGMRPPR